MGIGSCHCRGREILSSADGRLKDLARQWCPFKSEFQGLLRAGGKPTFQLKQPRIEREREKGGGGRRREGEREKKRMRGTERKEVIDQ